LCAKKHVASCRGVNSGEVVLVMIGENLNEQIAFFSAILMQPKNIFSSFYVPF